MPRTDPPTFLCLASYFKGNEFMVAARALGVRVLLLAKEGLRDEPWARDAIDELYFMPELDRFPDLLHGVAHLLRTHHIDRVIPLDEYDVEPAARLREHFCIPGMGESRARRFRDKLTMRVQAQGHGIPMPAFVPLFNDEDLRDYMAQVAPPWILKPRMEAGSVRMRQLHTPEEVWQALEELGDERSFYQMEQFIAGSVHHVESIVWEGEVLFHIAHQYGRPPMQVFHGGGIFTTHTMDPDAPLTQALFDLNRRVIQALGLERGVTHAEYIRGEADDRPYFLECAARVGGANIHVLVKAATEIDLWEEWARLEVAHLRGETYTPRPHRGGYAGLITCLARQEWPDLSGYDDPEVVWTLRDKHHHAGLVLASPHLERVRELLAQYEDRFAQDFLAVLPPTDEPP